MTRDGQVEVVDFRSCPSPKLTQAKFSTVRTGFRTLLIVAALVRVGIIGHEAVAGGKTEMEDLRCPSPFVRRHIVLCGTETCHYDAPGLMRVATKESLPQGATHSEAVVNIGGPIGKHPVAGYIRSNLSYLLGAGFYSLTFKPNGMPQTIVVEALAVSLIAPRTTVGICIAYSK